jgi:hypothetical protein
MMVGTLPSTTPSVLVLIFFGLGAGFLNFRPPDLWDFNMTSASKNSGKAHKFHCR